MTTEQDLDRSSQAGHQCKECKCLLNAKASGTYNGPDCDPLYYWECKHCGTRNYRGTYGWLCEGDDD